MKVSIEIRPFIPFQYVPAIVNTSKAAYIIYLFIYLMIYKIHLNAPRVVRIHHEEHQVNEPLARSL